MQQAATQQQPSERATSIDQLATAPPQQVPPQLAMQSDTELVNDILQEINQQPPANAGTVNANSPQQQQQEQKHQTRQQKKTATV